ncbi:DUF2505 family protein [Neoactinobaculum massilliense]|uniref:DUF2505 family protein n=1 Tax=Neoactinobaculum massilliense TaxID=2364794 RepID=UPI000F527AC0|nr:DUF2505 family protein [Neoactinobaculum massilliense]
MEIRHEYTVNVPRDTVIATLMSRKLMAARLAKGGVKEFEFSGDESNALTRAKVPTNVLPAAIRKLVPSGASATVNLTKHANTVTYKATATGVPATLTVSFAVTGDAVAHVSALGSLNIHVPLVGRALEKKASTYVDTILDRDAALVTEVASR